MLRDLLIRLWADEAGAIIATEYLMLGSIVAMGAAGGMVAMRDSIVDEYKEFGQGVREMRQSYSAPAQRGGTGKTTGANPTDNTSQQRGYTAPSAQCLSSICPGP
jgi:hypothetical protein